MSVVSALDSPLSVCLSVLLFGPQRKIGKQLRKIDEFPEDDRGGDPASGQVREE